MAAQTGAGGSRKRGGIRRMRGRFQVRVSGGIDPSTGERIVLTDSVTIEQPGSVRSEKAAMKEAEKLLTRLQAEADSLKVARTKSTVGELINRWLARHEIDKTTRMNYESQIRRYIEPNLGDIPVALLMRNPADRLETFYANLRRCKDLCDGRRSMEHRANGLHDCDAEGCKPHVCKPYAASSVRSIHAILSGAFSAGVRWGWVPYNPMGAVKPPTKKRPHPKPPSAAEMAMLIEAAMAVSSQWGLLVWLAAVTGARRGEVLALQWSDVYLEERVLRIDENWVRAAATDGLILKDTKSHQMRRVSIDEPTADLLKKYKEECTAQLASIGIELTGRHWLFSAKPDFSRPRDPGYVTRWYGQLASKLGIQSTLKELRHYSATELLTAGVDLRTVAGRLGHSDGTTTLRHYAAWVNAADEAAAATIGTRMPPLS